MKKPIGLITFAAVLVFLSGCAGYKLTIPEIVEMSDEDVPDQEICRKIDDSGMIYRLKGSQLAELSEAGLSDTVIDCIQQTYIRAARTDQSMEDWSNWNMGPGGYWYW